MGIKFAAMLAIILILATSMLIIYRKNHPKMLTTSHNISSKVPSNNLEPSNLFCPKYSYTEDKISLEETVTFDGARLEFYKNKAYTCGKSGYQTFLIVYPEAVAKDEPQNLWIRMHGGGGGAYDQNGQYVPSAYCAGPNSPCWIKEESLQDLGSNLKEKGLVSDVIKEGGFRFLVPSMCDHDFYSGIGDHPEENNPNTDANGQKSTADGLLALRSAIDFTRQKYPTTHIFAHGTSAGSIGALVLSTALSCEGKNISGAILDSGVVSSYSKQLVDSSCAEYNSHELDLISKKVGPFTNIRPDEFVQAGLIKTPLYDFWDTHDWSCACSAPDKVTIKDKNGADFTGGGCQIAHKELDDAISSTGKQSNSTFREVCIGGKASNGLSCTAHIPTVRSKAQSGGDTYRDGEDYNSVIMQWVRERLKDPLPKL